MYENKVNYNTYCQYQRLPIRLRVCDIEVGDGPFSLNERYF